MPMPKTTPVSSAAPDAPLNVLTRDLADHALHTAETLALRPVDDRERRFMLTFAVVADELFRLAARLDEELPPLPATYLDAGQRRALALVLAECLSDEVPFAHQAAALRAARRLIAAQAKDLQRAAAEGDVETEYAPLHDAGDDSLPARSRRERLMAGPYRTQPREAGPEEAAQAESEGLPWPWSHSSQPMYLPG